MRIILLGTVFMAIGTGMNNFIRAEGSPKTAMYTMLIGAATNIVLDYVFIFIFIPLLIILPHFWGLDGIWWSGPFSDLGAFILTSVWLWFEIRHLSKSDA